MSEKTMSGAEFKAHFATLVNTLKDDDLVIFGAGDLSLAQIKDRGPANGPRIVQLQFNEVYEVIPD